jgi:hypothetical protein
MLPSLADVDARDRNQRLERVLGNIAVVDGVDDRGLHHQNFTCTEAW